MNLIPNDLSILLFSRVPVLFLYHFQQFFRLLLHGCKVNAKKEEFEDTKGVIEIRKLKKDRQHNGQKKKVQKDKQRSTKHTYKNKDRVTRTPLKTGGELSVN